MLYYRVHNISDRTLSGHGYYDDILKLNPDGQAGDTRWLLADDLPKLVGITAAGELNMTNIEILDELSVGDSAVLEQMMNCSCATSGTSINIDELVVNLDELEALVQTSNELLQDIANCTCASSGGDGNDFPPFPLSVDNYTVSCSGNAGEWFTIPEPPSEYTAFILKASVNTEGFYYQPLNTGHIMTINAGLPIRFDIVNSCSIGGVSPISDNVFDIEVIYFLTMDFPPAP